FSSMNECIEPPRENRASIELLRQTAYMFNVNALHRSFFNHAIKLHTGDLNQTWRDVETRTSQLSRYFRSPARERWPWLPSPLTPRQVAIVILEKNPPLRRAARFVRSIWRSLQMQ